VNTVPIVNYHGAMGTKSRFSVASIVLWASLFAVNVVVLGVFFFMAVFSGRNVTLPGAPARDAVLWVVGALMAVSPLGNLVGLVLGVVGVRRREPRRIAGIFGIVLNALFVLFTLFVALLAWLGQSA
jgi:hypothetical protein